jgi:small subunit ribosomal protein S6
MKEYEVMFLVKPNLSDDKYKEYADGFQKIVEQNGGQIKSLDMTGIRELAQELKKMKKAYYVYSVFDANNAVLDELKKYFAVNEDIFRNLIVLTDSVKPKKEQKKVAVPTEA